MKLLGLQPPPYFKGNGCSGVPDGKWGEACRWHDYYYSYIRDLVTAEFPSHVIKAHRRAADAFFRANLKTLGGPNLAYWLGVRLAGWKAVKKNKKEGL